MNDFVVILPPRGATRADFETAIRQHTKCHEFIDVPAVATAEPIDDAEQLPLWRWFISS